MRLPEDNGCARARSLDLKDFSYLEPAYVWNDGSTLCLIGYARGNDSYTLYQTFIAELPVR